MTSSTCHSLLITKEDEIEWRRWSLTTWSWRLFWTSLSREFYVGTLMLLWSNFKQCEKCCFLISNGITLTYTHDDVRHFSACVRCRIHSLLMSCKNYLKKSVKTCQDLQTLLQKVYCHVYMDRTFLQWCIDIHRDPKKPAPPPNTLSYNAIISQYSFNKFYEMFEEVKDCKQ